MIGGRLAGADRSNTSFVCFALRAAHVHKQFIPRAVVHDQCADFESLHLVVSCLEEHLMALDGLLTKRHLPKRTALAAILVAEQVVARQQLPAVLAHGFRLRETEGTLGGGVPGHDHAVPIHGVGGFAGAEQ